MTKIIAIGNTLMQDDGIAIAVAKHLVKKYKDNTDVEFIIAETDAYYCINCIKEDDYIIFMDAIFTEEEAGIIKVYQLKEVFNMVTLNKYQHDTNVFQLCRLYGLKPEGYLIGITVREIGLCNCLSENLAKKFTSICNDIEKIICKLIKENKNA